MAETAFLAAKTLTNQVTHVLGTGNIRCKVPISLSAAKSLMRIYDAGPNRKVQICLIIHRGSVSDLCRHLIKWNPQYESRTELFLGWLSDVCPATRDKLLNESFKGITLLL